MCIRDRIHIIGRNLDGSEVSIEADELLSRLFQHELDHLDGVLLLDHLDKPERKAALRQWREMRSPISDGGDLRDPTSLLP